METRHQVIVGDSRSLDDVEDGAVDLVVTSPPYPMVEMWDEVFAGLDSTVEEALDAGEGSRAFELMHQQLDTVWNELPRVLTDGAIVCVNVGNATRSVDGSFRVYQNHSRILDTFEELGFEPLPELLWRKPVNSGTKFMGSGMIPPNAYVTLEHEYILVFRNGKARREFEPRAPRRYEAAYFWEERNRWFSDVWTDVTGEQQTLEQDELRERSAAFPFAIPYRLINMYSVYGDTVLDPFWGTGTTSLAALVAGRNSIGYEHQAEFVQVFEERLEEVPALSKGVVEQRLADHREFVQDRHDAGEEFKYEADQYEIPVMTKQEQAIRFYTVSEIEPVERGYRAHHEPFEETSYCRS